MKVVIGHLYPDYLNIYADRGNIAVFERRAAWRGIELEVEEIGPSLRYATAEVVRSSGDRSTASRGPARPAQQPPRRPAPGGDGMTDARPYDDPYDETPF